MEITRSHEWEASTRRSHDHATPATTSSHRTLYTSRKSSIRKFYMFRFTEDIICVLPKCSHIVLNLLKRKQPIIGGILFDWKFAESVKNICRYDWVFYLHLAVLAKQFVYQQWKGLFRDTEDGGTKKSVPFWYTVVHKTQCSLLLMSSSLVH